MDYESILEKQFENVLEGENFSGISEETARLSEGLSDPFTLENILQATLEQKSLFQSSSMIESLKELFLYEMKSAVILMAEILCICIILGLLRSLSDGFGSKSVSQLSLLVCTMVIIGISLNSFRIAYGLAIDTVSTMVWTMEILMPVLIGILIATGSVAGGTILSPLILGAVTAFGFLVKTCILPALYLSAVLSLINCLTEKNYVNKLAKLLRNGAVFLTGLILTILTGVITIQGLLTEASDGVLMSAAKYSISTFIPIVGGFTSDTVELFLRCMGSIRNMVGVFGLLSLLLMMAVPLLKILIVGGIYKLTGALMEPVSEGKTADGLSDMGNAMISIASVLFFTCLLFILFVTTIMNLGGAP